MMIWPIISVVCSGGTNASRTISPTSHETAPATKPAPIVIAADLPSNGRAGAGATASPLASIRPGWGVSVVNGLGSEFGVGPEWLMNDLVWDGTFSQGDWDWG